MSSGEQANQQPPAIENFLIVAYRSLRGNKRVSAFGCPKDLLDASPEHVKLMMENSCFVRSEVQRSSNISDIELRLDPTDPNNKAEFLLFEKKTRGHDYTDGRKLELFKAESCLPPEGILKESICESYYIHKGGFSGLTVIIHDCYVVILGTDLPRVLRYYKDEEGQIKCETTAIPVKPQHSYFNGWVSYNRSFVHFRRNVAYITREGKLAVLSITEPEKVKVWEPCASNYTEGVTAYVDVKLHNPRTFGLFAVTACGRIDYYQGAKRLVHSHTMDSSQRAFPASDGGLVVTTVGCDDDYVALGIMASANINRIATLKIKKSGKRVLKLAAAGISDYSVDGSTISNKNSTHHLAFMYPKRYRILYAQQLFTLGCLFYVDRRRSSLVHLCSLTLHVSNLVSHTSGGVELHNSELRTRQLHHGDRQRETGASAHFPR